MPIDSTLKRPEDRLSKHPQFQRRYIERWTELRRGAFETSQILGRIDVLVTSLGEAQQRNSNRWPTRRNHQDYVQQMKRWIQRRMEWIDQQLAPASGTATKVGAAGVK